MSRGKTVRFDARETIISAGALHSPALLLRAGIGPAEHLRALGIEVVADLPGVGGNLLEHASVSVAAHLKPGARVPPGQRRHIYFGARFSSGLQGCPPGDMLFMPTNSAGWHPLGQAMGTMLLAVNKSYSRGTVRLRTLSPHDEPRVDLNMLSDERDLVRLVDGFRRLYPIMESDAIRDQVTMWFPAGYSDAVRRLMVPSAGTWLKTAAARALLDLGAPGRMLLRRKLTGGRDVHRMVKDEERARGLGQGIGLARLACVRDLPHGPRRRPAGGSGRRMPRARRGGPQGRGRVGDADDPARQHQSHDNRDRRENRRRVANVVMIWPQAHGMTSGNNKPTA